MNAALITQLIVALGPVALELIPKLASIWSKQALTEQEVNDLLLPVKKSYDDYIAEAKAKLNG